MAVTPAVAAAAAADAAAVTITAAPTTTEISCLSKSITSSNS